MDCMSGPILQRNQYQTQNSTPMTTLIITILISLNIISTPGEYEQMTPEERAHVEVVITDLNL